MKQSMNKPVKNRSIKPDNTSANTEVDTDLQALFLDELADVYSAEQQLVKALPEMVNAAEDDELRDAFESHLSQTEEHVSRLDEVVTSLGQTMEDKTCAAMQGLVKEAQELLEEQKDSTALDAALIAAAQKVEHYEIASYGTLCAWARQLGHEKEAAILEETLTEEKAADERLTAIAESTVNGKGEEEA